MTTGLIVLVFGLLGSLVFGLLGSLVFGLLGSLACLLVVCHGLKGENMSLIRAVNRMRDDAERDRRLQEVQATEIFTLRKAIDRLTKKPVDDSIPAHRRAPPDSAFERHQGTPIGRYYKPDRLRGPPPHSMPATDQLSGYDQRGAASDSMLAAAVILATSTPTRSEPAPAVYDSPKVEAPPADFSTGGGSSGSDFSTGGSF